jgi:hypothetical protein
MRYPFEHGFGLFGGIRIRIADRLVAGGQCVWLFPVKLAHAG